MRATLTVIAILAVTAVPDAAACEPDLLAPAGRIVSPQAGGCFGDGIDRLFVEDDFFDACDPELDRSYTPPPSPVTRIEPGDPWFENEFGFRVATDGETILAASHRRFASSAIHILERVGRDWVATQQLLTASEDRHDNFAWAIAVDGDWLVAGAPTTTIDGAWAAGAAYIFRRTAGGWIQHRQLLEPVAVERSFFGISVAIDGETLVVGQESTSSPTTGAAYVYNLDGDEWHLSQKLESDIAGDEFGDWVDLDGDWLMVSASGDDRARIGGGAIQAFRRGADGRWTRTQTLFSLLPQPYQWWGSPFSIDGNRLAVGVTGISTVWGYRAGSVHMFREQGGRWLPEARIIATDGVHEAALGCSISLEGTRVTVGACRDHAPLDNSGSVYDFELIHGVWTETRKFVPAGATAYLNFGETLATYGDLLVAGAGRDSTPYYRSGAIYVVEPPPPNGYRDHGDYDVTLVVADDAGNEAFDSVDFVLDRLPPEVEVADSVPQEIAVPTTVPFTDLFRSADDDGAAGDVVAERLLLDGCVVYDGATYGNADGRLGDESLVVDRPRLCDALQRCGLQEFVDPLFTVEAEDCGGNLSSAFARIGLTPAVRATDCP